MTECKGTRTSYIKGCHCDACTAANTAYQEKWRRSKGVQPLKVGPQTGHGTSARYARHGCHCVICKRGNADRAAERRIVNGRRLAAGEVTVRHGSDSTYVNWLCHYPECTAAHSKKCDDTAARRKAAA